MYNDDAFVYAARLEEDTGNVLRELEDLSSSEDDIDSDIEGENVSVDVQPPAKQEELDQAEELQRQLAAEGGEPEELEEKIYQQPEDNGDDEVKCDDDAVPE